MTINETSANNHSNDVRSQFVHNEASAMPSSNLSSTSSSSSSIPASSFESSHRPMESANSFLSIPNNFPYKYIHKHCATCVRPIRCIRKPNFTLSTSDTNRNGSSLTNQELYSIIMNVNYYQNDLLPGCASGPSNDNNSEELDFCPVVRCPLENCPMILHYCKLPEHYLLCQYQKIACINQTYGCPYQIYRKDIAMHLKHCPANVIHCSMEWNRLPLYTKDKNPQTHVYCPPQALDTRNLDVALALRDQRMLKQLWSASRQMKRIMRGCLSTHPAVPIKPYIGVRTYREYGTHFTSSGNGGTNGDDEFNGSSSAMQVIIHHDEERYITFANKLVSAAYHDSLIEILKRTALGVRKSYDHERKLMASGGSKSYQRKKSNSICQMMNSSNLMIGIGVSSNNPEQQLCLPVCDGQPHLPTLSPPIMSMSSSSSINLPILSDSVIQSTQAAAEEEAKSKSTSSSNDADATTQTKVSRVINSPIPPPPPVPKCNALSLDVSIRSLAAYHPKPRAMYTFRCGMDFRVDECKSHYKDIHSDIHGGLDGWIEHRCPLFQYGCNFVHRRWAPTSAGQRKILIYNECLETFACSNTIQCGGGDKNDENGDEFPCENGEEIFQTSSFLANSRNAFKRDSTPSSSTSSYEPESSYSSRSYRSNSTTACCTTTTTTNHNYSQWNSSSKYCSTMSLLSPTNCASSCSTTISSPRTSPLVSPCSNKPGRSRIRFPPCLTDFPYEILQYICNYLDGYSLNNLSFTSHRLRLVVQSFLKKKGYVQLQWKRYETEKGKYRWSVAYKKWMFSTAIEPITGWTLDCNNVIAEHLRTCSFNQRTFHTDPFRCIFIGSDSPLMAKLRHERRIDDQL